MYSHGLGLPQDYDEALYWYQSAASQGIVSAWTDIGSPARLAQVTAAAASA